MIQSLLTTVDNPYNPFEEWDEWFAFDARMGYHTPGLLARIAVSSDLLSDADQRLAIVSAMDEIVELNPLGVHRKVTREVPDDEDEEVEEG